MFERTWTKKNFGQKKKLVEPHQNLYLFICSMNQTSLDTFNQNPFQSLFLCPKIFFSLYLILKCHTIDDSECTSYKLGRFINKTLMIVSKRTRQL
jgi:hypothetical protein